MTVPGTVHNPLYVRTGSGSTSGGFAPATISDTTYDADGNLTAWTQDGVDYEATYDAEGNLLTQGPA